MEREINQLVSGCYQFLVNNHYTPSTLFQYKSLWKRGILSYMEAKGETMYSERLGNDFIIDCYPDMDNSPTAASMSRSIRFLNDYLKLGYVREKAFQPVDYPLCGEIGSYMELFISHLQENRRSPITTGGYRRGLYHFLTYLTKQGITTVKSIKEHHILQFISTWENSKSLIVSYLHVLFRFWHEKHITASNYEEILKAYRWRRKERIPSFFNKEEVMRIEHSIDRSGSVGKRDYTMFLLASRLGLRASDIAKLKFANIDWEKNEITIIQYKTSKEITLPLLADIGNAIIDYLQYGRPKSTSQQIFISSRAPYKPVTSGIVCGAIRKIIEESDIKIGNRHHGAHSLRHSLASCLINYETPIPVITGILGHESSTTTMTYLHLDITSLLKCSLPVPAVSDEFYTQRGGAFYE